MSVSSGSILRSGDCKARKRVELKNQGVEVQFWA